MRILGPDVANVSLRRMAAKSDARVFSSAQRPGQTGGAPLRGRQQALPESAWPGRGGSRRCRRAWGASRRTCPPRSGRPRRVRRCSRSHRSRRGSRRIARRSGVPCVAPNANSPRADPTASPAGRRLSWISKSAKASEGERARMRLRRALDLEDLRERLVAAARVDVLGIEAADRPMSTSAKVIAPDRFGLWGIASTGMPAFALLRSSSRHRSPRVRPRRGSSWVDRATRWVP